ncbi:MAG: hypothetical protein HC784_01820, partial [Hydrococcus sp. CSU_1_8]|nr:hypothetical protein [Hydrococcus sp. CSU_1_8]
MSKKNYRVSSAIANLKFLASSLCLPIIFVLCIFSAIDSGTPARADELNQVLEEYWLAQNTAPFQPLPPLPQPTPVPLPQQPPEEPLKIPPTRSPQTPETVSETIVVTDFEFTGNTVFSAEELGKIKILGTEETIGSIENEAYSFSQLLQIASQVADFYAQKGYRTSGAVISIPQETQRQKKGIVTIQVIEGKLEAIQVREIDSKMRRRLDSYVEARLGAEIG